MSAQQRQMGSGSRNRKARNASIALLAVSVPVLVLGGVTVANAASRGGGNENKVDICHATASSTNPYTVNSIDVSSIDSTGNKYLNGHGDHVGPVFDGTVSAWGDIIPPFSNPKSGTAFPGYNWTTVGQTIWASSCNYVSPSPSPTGTPSGSVTPTQTPSESVTPTVTPSETVTPTVTPSETVTPTVTPSETVTPTVTPSETVTPTGSTTTTAPPVNVVPSEAVTESAPPVAAAVTEMPSPVAVAEQGTGATEKPLPAGVVPNEETGAISVPAGGGSSVTSQAALWGAVLMLLGGSGTAWGSFKLVALRKNESE